MIVGGKPVVDAEDEDLDENAEPHLDLDDAAAKRANIDFAFQPSMGRGAAGEVEPVL